MSNDAIPVGTDGYSLPIADVLMGRGFITGKSGSGKSNSTTVVLEELFEAGYPALVVDVDGEYYPLADEYDALHVGGDRDCDRVIDETDAAKIATVALEGRVPVVLDVAGYTDETAESVIESVVGELFRQEREHRTPYLLVLEEIHEYIPERGNDDLNELLVKVAKRGRKRGLGILGISQRPADVRKAFVTQCDWLVWHRLTWKNDVQAAVDVIGRENANVVGELGDGEAFVTTDWTQGVDSVQFRPKNVYDAGATPTLDDPGLGTADDALEQLTENREPPMVPADLSDHTRIGIDLGTKQLIVAAAQTGDPEIADAVTVNGSPERALLTELEERAERLDDDRRADVVDHYRQMLDERIDVAIDILFEYVDEFENPVLAVENLSYPEPTSLNEYVESKQQPSAWIMPTVKSRIWERAAEKQYPITEVYVGNSTTECHLCGGDAKAKRSGDVVCQDQGCDAGSVDRDLSAAVTIAGRIEDGRVPNLDELQRWYVENGRTPKWIAENVFEGAVSRKAIRQELREMGHLKVYQDPLWLEEKYHEEGLTLDEIADHELDGEVTSETVRNWAHTFDLIDDYAGHVVDEESTNEAKQKLGINEEQAIADGGVLTDEATATEPGIETKSRPDEQLEDSYESHREALLEIIRAYDGIKTGDLHDEYNDRVSDPGSRSTVWRRLTSLEEGEKIRSDGDTRWKKYYPVDDDRDDQGGDSE